MRLHGRFIIQISVLGIVLTNYVRSDKYTNTWAFHIEGGEAVARNLARKHAFVYVDQVRGADVDGFTLFHSKVCTVIYLYMCIVTNFER
jgi:hypothetical protein